jgi:NAD-dependent deacetylase
VDDLHQRAGSERAARLHGSIWQVRCTSEGTFSDNHEVPLRQLPCGALLRPHVVWFGEILDPAVLDAAYAAAEKCDLMLVVGTSALVHPAASLPFMAMSKGAYLIEVNLERTRLSPYADEVVLGRAAEELPRLWARLEEPRLTA